MNRKPTTQRANPQNGLRTHEEVAREWERISGERLTRSRIYQIERDALRKLAARLQGLVA